LGAIAIPSPCSNIKGTGPSEVMIMRRGTKALRLGAAACFAASVLTSQLWAQSGPQTPRGWNYDVDHRGNRVPRGNRISKPDSSWREELRQGHCVTIKERSATGEYKETRQCDPQNPST